MVKVPFYESEGRWFDSSGVSGFFIDTKSYGPRVDSASNRNEYPEYNQGVQEVGA